MYVVHDISRHAELNRLREQLLYSVAHELRGPLMVLDNALEILDTDYPDLTAAEFNQRAADRAAHGTPHAHADGRPAERGRHPVRALRGRAAQDGARGDRLDALEIVDPSLDGRGQRVEIELPEEPCR